MAFERVRAFFYHDALVIPVAPPPEPHAPLIHGHSHWNVGRTALTAALATTAVGMWIDNKWLDDTGSSTTITPTPCVEPYKPPVARLASPVASPVALRVSTPTEVPTFPANVCAVPVMSTHEALLRLQGDQLAKAEGTNSAQATELVQAHDALTAIALVDKEQTNALEVGATQIAAEQTTREAEDEGIRATEEAANATARALPEQASPQEPTPTNPAEPTIEVPSPTGTGTPGKVVYECVKPDQTPENPDATVLVVGSTVIAIDGETIRCESDVPGEHPSTYVATGEEQTETPVP